MPPKQLPLSILYTGAPHGGHRESLTLKLHLMWLLSGGARHVLVEWLCQLLWIRATPLVFQITIIYS